MGTWREVGEDGGGGARTATSKRAIRHTYTKQSKRALTLGWCQIMTPIIVQAVKDFGF